MSTSWPRRRALQTSLGAVVASAIGAAHGAARDLRAEVRMGGRVLVFAARDGDSLGDFTSAIGGFTQGCIRVTHDDTPLTVFFRPDLSGSRLEVVFELGRVWATHAENLGAYSVAIFDGRTQVAQVDVPQHFWFSRWRWQSSPRPVVVKVDDLMGRGYLPPYAREGLQGASVSSGGRARGLPDGGAIRMPQSGVTARGAALGLGVAGPPTGKAERIANVSYTIMGMAGLQPFMGATGERIDIGMVTEPQARFICTGAGEALEQLRAQAEAGGTCPWHVRDEKTGALVDLEAYPRLSWYRDRRVANPYVPTASSEVTLDTAHEPALAYLPYLLTGDPYHLEDLQFATNWAQGAEPPDYRYHLGQTRGFAWYIRDLATCAKVTPTEVPRWLKPKAYFERNLARWNEVMMRQYVRNQEPQYAVFRALGDPGETRDEGPKAPAGTYMPPWQSEFVAAVAGWIVMMGYSDWRPFFDWQIASTIARTSGRSGWHRSHATPYRLLLRPSKSAPYVRSWAQAWTLQAPLWGWEGTDPHTITEQDLTYYFYTRGALVLARKLAVPDAGPCLEWLESQLAARGAVLPYKWRLA